MNREYDKQFAYRSIRQPFKKIHVSNVPKSKSLPQPLPTRRRLPPPAEDINDVGNVPKSKPLPPALPPRRRLPPPRFPAEDINAEHTYDDVDSHYLHVSFKHDNQEPVEEYEYQECIAKVIYKNDYSYSSLWDKTPLTDVQRRNSKRLLPEVLTRLDHESVSTYLNCLKDGEERRNGIRLVIVGRQNTGKTSLTKRLLKESVENVQQTNGIQIHTLKCRGKVDEGNWIFHDGRTYDNEINSRLLKCCIAKSKANLSDDSNMATGYLSSKRPDESESEKSDNEFNACNLEEPDMSPTTFYQAHEVPVRDFYNLYDIVYAEIDAEDTAPIAIWDFAGDGEHSNTHQTFFGQESIYVVVSNVMDTIENDDPEYKFIYTCGIQCNNMNKMIHNLSAENLCLPGKIIPDGLAFWLETIRCHCKSVDEEYYNDYQEPPVIIVGTHKDQFKGNNIDCKTQFQRQVHEIVRNSQIRRNIRKMYVISNTDDTDDEFDILRRDLVEIAKSRKQWNIKTPARWIHLEKALFENSYGKPVVAKSDIAEIANNIIQPITDEEELERFLTYHNGIGTYVYFSDLPEYVVLDSQWLESAFKCIITANQFQKDLVHQTEWKELRRDGRLSEKLLNEIFLHQEDYIKKYRAHLLKIMEKFNIIVRPRTMSDAYEINEESDYYVPCMIKKTSLSNIKEKFFNCPSKSSCLCVEFDFLPPSFATQILVACTRYYTVAKGPQTNDGRHPAFYRDFAIYNLDATGCEKLLIANYQNVLQIQIWKCGEPEKRSYHDVKAKLLGIIEEMQQMRIQPSLSYELKLKCKYTDYECLDGMVDLKVIKPQKEYFCEEHGNTHNSEEIYFDWVGEIEQKIFSREQINATRMAIIILEILTSALYDLFISDFCGFSVKPRDECDITYLYAQLRRNNKHIPGHGWGCEWSDILNSHMLIGDDIERIRLARNVMAHLTKFSLDDNKYYELCGILAKVLYRLEIYNGKGKLYTDQMKNVKKQEIKLIDWQNYEKKITSEFPRLKMKPSFEVKVGFGCTLECEIIVPLPDGSKVYWIKEENSKEEELTVDKTTSNKYKGSQSDYASLNIYCATKEDEGHYSCRIRYPEESAESMDENVKWPKTYLHVNNYVFEAKEDRKQKNKEHKPKRLMATLTSENAEIVENLHFLLPRWLIYLQKKLPRDRKANFTSIEANLISSRVTHELELLKGGFSPEVTNQKKNELWKVITEEVNALGVCMRSETEVRNKYRNMCRGTKEKFTNNRKEMSKTGGGPPPTQLTIAEENIVNAMRDSDSFIEVGGLETEITCNEAISATNGSQSPCTATATPRPTAEASVWMRALDRHHANLQNNEQTCPVADDAEGTDRNAKSSGPSISASSQSKRSSSSCSIQQTPIKKKKTAEDVYTLQCAVLEKELEKNTLQVDLLRKLLSKYDS